MHDTMEQLQKAVKNGHQKVHCRCQCSICIRSSELVHPSVAHREIILAAVELFQCRSVYCQVYCPEWLLVAPDNQKACEVVTDSSQWSLGAVLMQEGRHVAYES